MNFYVRKRPASEVTIYLCGPIKDCTDAECRNWRDYVTSIWPGKTLDPMRRDYRGREMECMNEIVELDKEDIQRSHALIVNFDKPSVGTSMEVFLSWLWSIPVVVVCKEGMTLSPWLVYHSTVVVHSHEAAVEWLKENLCED